MSKQSDYYADKARFSVIVSEPHQARLGEIAKQYKITQGEVIETLLDHADHAALESHYQAVRDRKLASRAPKKELIKQLGNLTAEQLKALLKQAQAQA